MHPAIAALRNDPFSQRRASAAMNAAKAAWLADERVADVAEAMAAWDKGARLSELAALSSLVRDISRAEAFVGSFFEVFEAVLRNEPLGEVPLRHGSSASFSRLQLIQSEGVVLSLCAYEPVADGEPPQAAQFVDCEAHEIVISGRVSGLFMSRENGAGDCAEDRNAQIDSRQQIWQKGSIITRRACQDARHFVSVKQSVLLLQLSRTPTCPKPTREYRLSDGALVQQVSGEKRASEHVMALAVLGALGHRDGIGAMREYAKDAVNDTDARWEAVRQILALDTGQGFALLAELASIQDDILAKPAGDLRDHLLAAQPAFRDLAMEIA